MRQAIWQRFVSDPAKLHVREVDGLVQHTLADIGLAMGPSGRGPEHQRSRVGIKQPRPVIAELIVERRQQVHHALGGVGLAAVYAYHAPPKIYVAPTQRQRLANPQASEHECRQQSAALAPVGCRRFVTVRAAP